MAERREAGLRRGVGLGLLAAVLLVNLAMAVFVSLGVVADEALGATPLVFVAAGVAFGLVLLGYLEGIAMLPQAGGAAGFARRGLGELSSFIAGWALLLDYLILVVLTSYVAVHYLGSIPGLGWLLERPVDGWATALLIVAVALLALRGVRAGARVVLYIALVALAAQLLLAVVGLLVAFEPGAIGRTLELGTTPTWRGVLFALPIAIIGFTGLDTIANLGGELQKPGRDIPRPIVVSALASVLVFVTMSVVALNAQPVTGSGEGASTPLGRPDGWVDRPVIGIVEGLGMPGPVEDLSRVLFGVLAGAVLFLAANAAVAGMGRTVWYMSQHRQAPSALFSIDRRSGVPRRAIAVLTLVALLLLLFTVSFADSAVVLAQTYAFGATITAALACVSVARLRMSEPALERPFRAPGSVRIGGRELPVLVMGGAVASVLLWLLVVATHDAARVVGFVWMVFGLVAYGTYRFTHGLSLVRRADPRELQVPSIEATSYRRLLVAVRPERGMLYGAGDAELVGLAHKLLDADDPRPTEVSVILVHELPLVQPLDAPLGDVEEQTMRRLARIREAASRLDLRIASSVARARAAGRAICQEAERRGADAVLLAARTKPRVTDQAFGKTVAYVLRHAPCDVVVLNLPEQSLRGPDGGAVDPARVLVAGRRGEE